MYKPTYNITELNLPLKQEIPTLHYDIALYCKKFLDSVEHIPSDFYLETFSEKLHSYASQVSQVKPKTFTEDVRIYIIDCRLNVLFATLDKKGKVANSICHFKKYTCSTEDYHFSDRIDSAPTPWSPQQDIIFLAKFYSDYGYLPLEPFSHPSLAIFVDDRLEQLDILTQYQVTVLMEKYKRRNLINWKDIVAKLNDFYFL